MYTVNFSELATVQARKVGSGHETSIGLANDRATQAFCNDFLECSEGIPHLYFW